MKKKFDAIVIVIYLMLSVVVLGTGFYICDALPNEISEVIDNVIKSENVPVNKPGESVPGFDNPSKPVINYTVSLPKSMSGVWFNLGNELSSPSETTTANLVAEIGAYFDYFANFRSDTVFVTPDIYGKYSYVTDDFGNSVDLLRETLRQAIDRNYYTVLVLNDEMLYNTDGVLDGRFVTYYLDNYEFDAVCLSSEYLMSVGKIAEATEFFGSLVRDDYPKKQFGLDIFPSGGDKLCNDDYLNALGGGYVSFACVEGLGAIPGGTFPFRKVMSHFNGVSAKFPEISFFGVCRADYVNKNVAGFGSSTEISDEIRYIFDCENLDGFVLRDALSLKSNPNSFARHISSLLIEPQFESMMITRVVPHSDTNTVDFYGVGDYGHRVYCNDKVVASNGGSFKYTARLIAGENNFDFFCNGNKVTYSFYSNSHLIDSYHPAEDINVSKNDIVNIYAVCIDGAEVNAYLNSRMYKMEKNPSASLDSVPEGYSVYSCGVSFANNSYIDLNLGNIRITAEYCGSKETVTCGRVTLLKSDRSDFLNSLLEFTYSTFFRASKKEPSQIENVVEKGISPYNDNGLGTALMCRVIEDGTEQLGTVDEYDTYHPTYSTLPKGMYDYVERITSSAKGYVRYELRSGMSVYSNGVQLINNAFTMPENRVIVYAVDESDNNSTNIIFNNDWFSPVQITTSRQRFTKGYLDYSFNISKFNAEYIDIKFYYTKEFYNKALLNFDEGSPFSSSELYSDGKGNMILRLFLKKAGQFYGYDIFENSDGRLVLSFKKHLDGSLSGKTIMLDPGHGGLTMTGTATRNDIAESRVTLSIACKVRDMLTSLGANVIMTRTSETPLTLPERVAILTKHNPDLYASIHCDGSENIGDSGTHTFYYTPFSKPLATAINSSLVNIYKTKIYSPGDSNYRWVDRGTKYFPFYVTRMFNCPSVLIETGFMTNPTEGLLLESENCRYWIAQGIADGIKSYFAENN